MVHKNAQHFNCDKNIKVGSLYVFIFNFIISTPIDQGKYCVHRLVQRNLIVQHHWKELFFHFPMLQ